MAGPPVMKYWLQLGRRERHAKHHRRSSSTSRQILANVPSPRLFPTQCPSQLRPGRQNDTEQGANGKVHPFSVSARSCSQDKGGARSGAVSFSFRGSFATSVQR